MDKWLERGAGNQTPLSGRALATARYAAGVRSQGTPALLNTAEERKVPAESQLCLPPGITAVQRQPGQPGAGASRTCQYL